MAITLRDTKGTALTHGEVDLNFSSYFYTASLSGQVLSLIYPSSSFSAIPSMSITLPSASKWSDISGGGITRNSTVEVTGSFNNSGSISIVGNLTNGNSQLIALNSSHAQGDTTIASGSFSHTEGNRTVATGSYSHAEGESSQAKGDSSHAEGKQTTTIGEHSHAEGNVTVAFGTGSHAEGNGTIASGSHSHAEGLGTITSGLYQHAQGQYNISSSAQSAFIIGNGISDGSRSNLVFASGSQFEITGSLNVTGSLLINGVSVGAQVNDAAIGVKGIAALASTSDVTAGTDATTIVTPATLRAVYGTLDSNTSLGSSNDKYPTQLAVKTYVDALAVGLLNDRGNHDASSNTFPASGGSGTAGAIMKGDIWYISIAGILGGTSVAIGASVRALVDSPASATDWDIIDAGLGITPENILNKTGSIDTQTTDDKYPSVKAVKTYVDTAAVIRVSGSSLYSNNPATTQFSTTGSIFFGSGSGMNATVANESTFLGTQAGQGATNANKSNFLGRIAGLGATSANNSNFIGNQSGWNAISASTSNFIGTSAGYQAISASNSTLIGFQAGANVGGGSIGSNNIIIGTNLTLPAQQKDSINLGGIIFATGSYSDTTSNIFSGSMPNAKVGIATSTPQFTLDVSGSTRTTNGLTVTGSLLATGSLTLTGSLGISGSITHTGGYVITGSARSQVITVGVSSNTASINLALGNFFSVTLTGGPSTVTHISASNIQPGQTANLRIIQSSSPFGTASFSPAFKQPSGSAYTASAVASAVDVLSFISFDSTSLYATAIKNLI